MTMTAQQFIDKLRTVESSILQPHSPILEQLLADARAVPTSELNAIVSVTESNSPFYSDPCSFSLMVFKILLKQIRISSHLADNAVRIIGALVPINDSLTNKESSSEKESFTDNVFLTEPFLNTTRPIIKDLVRTKLEIHIYWFAIMNLLIHPFSESMLESVRSESFNLLIQEGARAAMTPLLRPALEDNHSFLLQIRTPLPQTLTQATLAETIATVISDIQTHARAPAIVLSPGHRSQRITSTPPSSQLTEERSRTPSPTSI